MKTTNREEFEKQNVFGTGNANTAYAQYFTGESFLNPLTNPENGRRTAACLHSRRRLVSGGRKRSGQLSAGNGYYNSCGSKALARCEEG